MPPSTIIARPVRNSAMGYGREPTPSQFGELVRQGIGSGAYQFEPYLDRHTEETAEQKAQYTRMLRHSVVKAALLGKINAVSALDLTIAPASDQQRDGEIAEFCKAAYTSEMDGGLLGIAENILLPGLMMGTSINERVWREEPKERGKWKGKRFWRKFKAKQHARLKVDEFSNITAVCSTFGQNQEWEPTEFVIFRFLQLYEGPGMSDLRAANAAWVQHVNLSKLRLIYLDKCAKGVYLVGHYQQGNQGDRAEAEAALTAATAGSWALLPEGVTVEVLKLAMGAESEFKSALDSLEEKIALAISGAFLQMLTAGGGGDMRGDSATQKSTSELFIWALSTKFCELLNKQATPYLVDENFVDADYPTAALGGVNYAEMNQLAGLYKQATDMGAKPSRKAFALATGIQLATDTADSLLPPALGQPIGPGSMFPPLGSDQSTTGAGAAPGEDQSEAVATNDLRATVGGSTAIAALQTAFYKGELPRDAVIANATVVFGFTPEEAEALFPAQAPVKLTPEAGQGVAPQGFFHERISAAEWRGPIRKR